MISRKTPFKTGGLKLKGIGSGSLKSGGLGVSKGLTPKKGKVGRKVPKNEHLEDQAFYAGVWAKRRHTCEVCGDPLDDEMKVIYMDHGLEKNYYPELRHEEYNIIISCISCHSRKSLGHPLKKHTELIQKIKDRFYGKESSP